MICSWLLWVLDWPQIIHQKALDQSLMKHYISVHTYILTFVNLMPSTQMVHYWSPVFIGWKDERYSEKEDLMCWSPSTSSPSVLRWGDSEVSAAHSSNRCTPRKFFTKFFQSWDFPVQIPSQWCPQYPLYKLCPRCSSKKKLILLENMKTFLIDQH